MFIYNEKRININAALKFDDVTYPVGYFNNADEREKVGIVEIEEPEKPADFSDELYFVTETDEAPYVIYTRKPDEMINQIANAKIIAEISIIESGQARALREATLTGDTTRLQEIETKIAELRSKLVK